MNPEPPFEKSETSEKVVEEQTGSSTFADRFRVIRKLGEGAHATVYEAEHLLLGKMVAVKFLKDDLLNDEQRRQRFLNEARLANTLSHPNISKTIAFGFTEEGRPYIVMEKASGLALDAYLKSGAKLSPAQCRAVALQLCDALAHSHEKHILHRDIKPSNIFVDNSEDEIKVILLDFGIARRFSPEGGAETLTQAGSILGTPKYMSPEQCKGLRADFRSDIYSLGCVIFECLSSRPPFDASSEFELLSKQVNEQADFSGLERISPNFSKILMKCLEKDPTNRYQSATELAQALRDLRLDEGRQPKKPVLSITVALAVLLALSVTIFAAQSYNQERKNKPETLAAVKTRSQFKHLGENEIPYEDLAERAIAAATRRQPDFDQAVDLMTHACKNARKGADNKFLARQLPRLAGFYAIKRDFAGAEKQMAEALRLASASDDQEAVPDIYRHWTDLVHRQGNNRKALELCEKAISLNEKERRYISCFYSSAAELAAAIPDWTKAAKYAETALTLGPDSNIDQYRTGVNAELKISKDKWEQLSMQDILIHKQVLFREKNLLSRTVQDIVGLGQVGDRSCVDHLLGAASCLCEKKHTEQAKLILSMIPEEFADTPIYLAALNKLRIQVLLQQGDSSGAEKLARTTLAAIPDSAAMEKALTKSALADVLNSMGKNKEGLKLHKEAIQLAEAAPLSGNMPRARLIEILKSAASASQKSGNYQEAADRLKQAIATLPGNGQKMDRQDIIEGGLRLELAKVLLSSGEKEPAKIEIEEASRLTAPYASDYKELSLELKNLRRSLGILENN